MVLRSAVGRQPHDQAKRHNDNCPDRRAHPLGNEAIPARRKATLFYLTYMMSELRRRKGRTLLTALGLAVGVGLVVTVTALSKGLDRAQDEVLKPLTGVGTDMSVSRPL